VLLARYGANKSTKTKRSSTNSAFVFVCIVALSTNCTLISLLVMLALVCRDCDVGVGEWYDWVWHCLLSFFTGSKCESIIESSSP